MKCNECLNKPIETVKSFFIAADNKIENATGQALTYCGKQWQAISTGYHEKICVAAGNFVGSKIHSNLKNPVTTALKALPVALAILAFASPLTIVGGLVKGILLGTVILLSTPPLTKDAKIALCQGGVLAVAIKTSFMILKGSSFGGILLISAGGIIAADALYYASRHFQK